jgi:hypothetical protein
MAANKNFQNETEKAKRLNSMWVCSKCGKTVHIGRKFCNCHNFLSGSEVLMSENSPEIDICNFETDRLTCADCPEICTWCASFGVIHTNERGFGGRDCRHRNNDARCFCCQAQVEIGLGINEINFGDFVSRDAENTGKKSLMKELADVIQARMEKPVLARINGKREKAG